YYLGKSLGGGPDGDLVSSPREENILYRNNGDGTFTDVTRKAGLRGKGWSGDVAVFDYDGDGRLDLLVTNMVCPSQLDRNNGDGTFTDVTRRVLGATSYGSIGAKAFDVNNDGRLDLFLADMHSDMWMGADFQHASRPLALMHQGRKFPTVAGPYVDKYPGMKELKGRRGEGLLGHPPEGVGYGNTLFENLGGGKVPEGSHPGHLETLRASGA